MPIYEYECENCGAVEEVLQKFSDKPLTTCKHCSGKVHRIISQSTFHLKGTGWYVTDYAKGSTTSASCSKPKTVSTTDTKTIDTKTAATKTTDAAK